MEFDGLGRVKYMEFENDIWIMDVFTQKRGTGTRLAREFIEYAKMTGKSIYGQAKPKEHHSTMDLNRLIRWYGLLGAKPIKMRDHPTAMKLEIKNV